MKKKSILGNCYLNNWKLVLAHSIPVTLTFDPKSIGFLLLPMMDVWTRYEESRSRCSCVIHQKRFRHIWSRWPWPLTQWLKINWIPLLPRMDVWTKFEEGRSRHFWVIDRKQFLHIWPRWNWPLIQWPQNQ